MSPRNPNGPGAMTAAERKRRQRTRDRAAISELPISQWSERQCLIVLNGHYGQPLQRAAWRQLGKLRGWLYLLNG